MLGSLSLTYFLFPPFLQIGTPELAARLLDAKANPLQNGIIDNQEERSVHRMSSIEQQPDDNIIHSAFPNKNEKIMKSSYGFEVSKQQLGLDENSPLEGQQSLGNGEIVDLTSKKVEGGKIVSDSDSNKDSSTSILDKLFGSVLTVNTGVPSSFVEVMIVLRASLAYLPSSLSLSFKAFRV